MDQTALQPERGLHGSAAGPGPDNPETRAPELHRRSRIPRGLPPRGAKQESDGVADRRGCSSVLDVRGRGETLPATATCFPAPCGLPAGAQDLGPARLCRGAALPTRAPSVTPPVRDVIPTCRAAPKKVAASLGPAGITYAPVCRRAPLQGPTGLWWPVGKRLGKFAGRVLARCAQWCPVGF